MHHDRFSCSHPRASPGTLSWVLPGGEGRERPKGPNATILSILPYCHHPKSVTGLLGFVYFIPVVAKQKMPALAQENPTPSPSKGWARWSWYPKAHLPPLARMLPASLSGQGTRRKSRARQTCVFPSWWVSFLLIFCPPGKGKADGSFSPETMCKLP